MSAFSRSQDKVRFGTFEADLRTGELRTNGQQFTLQEQPFQLLMVFLEHPGELITRDELKKILWPSDVFVDFDHSINKAVNRLREALGDSAENSKFVETLHRKGYRWIGPIVRNESISFANAQMELDVAQTIPTSDASTTTVKSFRKFWKIAIPAGVLVIGISLGIFVHIPPRPLLTEKDSVILADFVNNTGDPVFDDTLKQGLSVQLSQSPFFNVLPDQKVNDTLKLMGRTRDYSLTPEVAREICVRTNSKVMLAGSISSLGTQYVVGLKALNCDSAETLAQFQVQAETKEEVLKVLGQATMKMRQELGESLSSIRRFNIPDQVTTPSLEALKAWSAAEATRSEQGDRASLPFLKRAIELDQNFAMAHAKLATVYINLQENTLSAVSIKRAFELRDQVSEKERFYIDSHYYQFATGELEKANEVYELWARTYPRSGTPFVQLAGIHLNMGQFEKAVTESIEALRRDPHSYIAYTNLTLIYTSLNRLDDASATYRKMRENQLEYPDAHVSLYAIAAARPDEAKMHNEVAWASGKLGIEDIILAQQADTEAFHGRLGNARELSRRAIESGQRAGKLETAAFWQMNAALREAVFGNRQAARHGVTEALALAATRDVQTLAALVWARAGNTGQARAMSDALVRRYPLDTLLNGYWLPTIRAVIELDQNNPGKALGLLQGTASYELGGGSFTAGSAAPIHPAYVRGEAYLKLHRPKEAAAEYEKFAEHWGAVRNCPLGALARLGSGRAYAMQGDFAKAHIAYDDFFALWKDADSDIPILKQAKAEYARLR